MTEVTSPEAGIQPMSLPARIAGVVMSPRQTYAAVAAHPKSLGVLLVTIVASAAITFWFQSTETGQKAVTDAIEQQIQLVERLTGNSVPDEQYDAMMAGAARAPYQSAIAIVVSFPLLTAVFAGILLGVFNGVLGGAAKFRQVFAIVAHSGVVWTLVTVISVLMGFIRGDATGATRLSAFVPGLEDGFVASLLGYIDLLWLWGFFSLAVGVAVLYRRRTGPIALTFIGLYLVVGILYAGVASMF